jgi:hypothetical protein
MVLTSTANIQKGSGIINMLMIDRCMHQHAVTTYKHTCWPRFGESDKIERHSSDKNDIMVEWLRLQTHMKWFPHPLHTYT